MKSRPFARTGVALGLLVMLLVSCESLRFSMMKDDELVAGGIQAWNTEKVEAARGYWSAIKDPTLKAEWLAKLDQYEALDKTFDDALAVAPTPEAPLLAGWNTAVKAYKAFPAELKIPATLKPRLTPVARSIVEGRIQAEKGPAAKEFMKTAEDFLGAVDWTTETQELKDLEKTMAINASYRALDKSLEKTANEAITDARNQPQFDDQIAGYEAAIVTITKAEQTLAAQAKVNGYREGTALANLPDKYKRKRAEARTEMEKTLRDRAYSFKERIGEEFARTPEGDQLGSMGVEDILKFYEGTRTNIEAMQAEVIAFAAKYPKIIDKDMLKDVDDQKKALEARIVQVTAEVEKARADAKVAAEIASRGKAIIPLLIGLFNPQPGTKGNDQKSRPGKFRGTLAGDTVYWWGLVSIEKNTLNDLVVTVNDNRPVRVFDRNTKSGALVDGKTVKDLVNRQYKVGNSWPVINAGAQLPAGAYYFELGKGKDAKYSGDVVVYSSFIVRSR